MPPVDDQADTLKPLEPDSSASPFQRPRIWTVFTAVALALVTVILFQLLAVAAWLGWQAAQGEEIGQATQRLAEVFSRPGVVIVLGLASQLIMGLAAILPALMSSQPVTQRLGLVRSSLRPGELVVVVLGAFVPLAIGVSLAWLISLVIPPDPSVATIYDQMTPGMAIPFILFIALAPGFMEEMLFRGYLQTRLLERWSPWLAILVTSVLFAIFHITPHAMANAFVLGIWLGVVAWRTGSIWPCIISHAAINGAWNIWHVGQKLWGFPEQPPIPLAIVGGVVAIGCFALAVWILRNKHLERPSQILVAGR